MRAWCTGTLLTTLLLATRPAFAQPAPAPDRFVHERWTTADGLPVNALADVLQARDGYLWVATRDGLVRFDGARFVAFNRTNTPGMPENRLVDLEEGRDGTLWLRTEQNRLFRFRDGTADVVDARLGLHGLEVQWMYETPDDTLLVATEKALLAWTGDRLETRWSFEPEGTPSPDGLFATFLFQDSRGARWIGTNENGLIRLADGRTTVWSHMEGRPLARVVALAEDDAGRIWVQVVRWDSNIQSHTSAGLFVVEHDQMRRVTFGPPCRPDALPAGARLLSRDDTGCLVTYAGLYFTGNARPISPSWPWMLASPPRMPPGQRLFLRETNLYRDDGARLTVEAAATSAAVDHEGNIWVTSNGAGLYRFRPVPFETYGRPEGLFYENIYTSLVDREGAIWSTWMHAGDGLYRLGSEGVTRFYHGFRSRRITALYQDRAGTLWVGTMLGPCRIRRPDASAEDADAVCVPLDLPPLASEMILSFLEDRDGGYWLGADLAVLHYRPDAAPGRAWTVYSEPFGPANRRLRAVAEGRNGWIWFGSSTGGLTAFVPGAGAYEDGRFFRMTTDDGLPSDIIRDLFVDDDGFVWVVTEDAGLARLDVRGADTPADARLAVVQQRDGLPDNTLHSLRADTAGYFWISSNRGLFRVARADLNAFADRRRRDVRFTVYTERDGLRNREFNGGYYPSSSRDARGRLYFPSQAGVVVVDPARIRYNDVPPPVAIEAVRSQGQPVAAGRLRPDQRSFEVDYTALSFVAPENVRFRYRLDGFDSEWVEAGARRTAYYTRVPPGTYTFRVVACNNDGVWNETGAVLELTLEPRFYETAWFYALCALLLAGLALGTYRRRVRQMRARQHLLEAEVAARTRQVVAEKQKTEDALATVAEQAGQLLLLTDARSRFFANVSHEFRTPLTLILGPLDDALDRGEAPDLDTLALMRRNAAGLLALINQILDLSRLDAGGLVLRVRRHDLVAFVRRCVALFESLARLQRLTLRFEAAVDALPCGFDDEKLAKVVLNLLSNAVKFTPEGGTVAVSVASEAGGGARLVVEDTGVGIPPADLPHVFDRFYQAGSAGPRRHGGSGIGLAIVRELVVLHGGTIGVWSEEGRGTRFTVVLPDAPVPPEAGDGRADPLGEPSVFDLAVLSVGAAPGPEAAHDAPAEPTDEPTDGPTEGPTEGPTDDGAPELPLVLVVEDNADLRAYIRHQLAGAFQLAEAADGADGLEKALALVPDLVISDVMMPGMDGYALCRTLKTDERTSHVPVVLLTARADAESKIAGLETGADDYVPKPFHAEELRVRVRNLIEGRRRLRARFSREVLVLGVSEVALPAREVSFLEHVQALVEAHISNPDFGVDALAEALSMGRRQLERKLQALIGEAPGGLLRRVRLERAAHLLRQESTTVKEVAAAVGYRSVPHFTQAFREAHGVSPTAFAAQARD